MFVSKLRAHHESLRSLGVGFRLFDLYCPQESFFLFRLQQLFVRLKYV